jgi:hypothetical protein
MKIIYTPETIGRLPVEQQKELISQGKVKELETGQQYLVITEEE